MALEISDELRDAENATNPDPRSEGFSTIEAGFARPYTLQDRSDIISSIVLNPEVPSSIRVQFDTARNLYLYAWFVYRFHTVAEQHALAALEFALREWFISAGLVEGDAEYIPGLKHFLKDAVTRGLIANERLSFRQAWAVDLARNRLRQFQVDEMTRLNASEMTFIDSEIRPTKEDLEHDWIGVFIEALPDIRNTYAHGTDHLHHTVLRTFHVVADLVNQLFAQSPVSYVDLKKSS